MQKLVDVSVKHIWDVLSVLLEDKTTGKNVVWATDAYASRGPGFGPEDQITKEAFIGDDPVLIQPRIEKDAQEQQARTKKKAEVYTPSWLCNKMNNYCDAEWFGRPKVFNEENGGGAWTARKEPIWFNQKKGRKTKEWQKYVDSRRLEITCGEAPFLVSRYDAATGDILPIDQRIGILDRKLRVVDENTTTETDWLKWAQRAVESCYGYEYQGDSLLIARINVLMTFYDYYAERWKKLPEKRLFKKIANIVAWNIWQMDGLNDAPPFGKTVLKTPLPPLLQQFAEDVELESAERVFEKPAKIKNWRSNKSLLFIELKELRFMKKKMFDFVIGNPPYQEEFSSEGNKTYAAPVYNLFMEASYKIAGSSELIHPARFLFNAGSTPKDWNQKMLNDQHFKVLSYEEDATQIFQNTEIKGGIAVSLYNHSKNFGAVVVFTKFQELNSILKKVRSRDKQDSIDSIIYIQNRFNLQSLLNEHPECKSGIGSGGRDSRFEKNIFEKIPLFTNENLPNHIRTIGIFKGKRIWKYLPTKYVDMNHENLCFYKVVLPVANGSGEFGQTLSTPFVAKPNEAYTRSFIGIGAFKTKEEADAVLKYLKGKFSRAMLSVLKVTQMTNKDVWKYVPLQDFTSESDIDWSKSIAEIDRQLYEKYGLSQEETTFIETHVKEMN